MSVRSFYISGFTACRNYQRAISTAALLTAAHPEVKIEKWESDRDAYHIKRVELLKEFGMDPESHKTSPLIFELDEEGKKIKYIGGGSDFCDLVKADYQIEPAPLPPKMD